MDRVHGGVEEDMPPGADDDLVGETPGVGVAVPDGRSGAVHLDERHREDLVSDREVGYVGTHLKNL
ncbi:hypothetical protein ACNPNP_10955 [Microbacterium sp. AGC85]